MTDAVRYQVADLIIDPGRGRVMRGDTEVPLPKLSFDLLLVLTRAAPNLLSIEALIERVWPGLVVSPETVSQRVKLLRDALGDDPKLPRYIAGLRGRGYQIIAPVETIPVEVAPPSVTPQVPPKQPVRIRTLTAVVLFGLVLAIGGYFVDSRRGSRSSSNASASQGVLTGEREANAAFTPPPRSIAVLSFVNLSGDARDEYFSDGLSEELVHALTRITQLRVAARTSSFSFKGSPADIPTVGRRLNVGSVLEGSVRKSGSRVRVTAQLIDARTGYHLWSQTYDRELKDILAVQTEIAKTVAGTLQVALLGDAEQNLTVGGTKNPSAFDAYLRGRHSESIQDEAGLRAAVAALDEAVTLDPEYANAHAFRADVLAQLANQYIEDPKERQRLSADALAAAERAVALAPRSGLAHAELGNVLAVTSADYARIDAEYKRSIELEPGNAELLRGYASYAALFGRPDALSAAKRSVSLDPLSRGAQANLGVALYYARRHDEARAAFQEAVRLGTNRLTLNWIGVNELAAGKPEAALPYCQRDPNWWYDQFCLAMAYHKLGRTKEAAAMLEKIQKVQGDGGAYQYASIHAYWGDRRAALRWLARAVELEDGGLLAIKTDPFLDSIRNTREFAEIVKKLNLPS